jgi:hypothetical protein
MGADKTLNNSEAISNTASGLSNSDLTSFFTEGFVIGKALPLFAVSLDSIDANTQLLSNKFSREGKLACDEALA